MFHVSYLVFTRLMMWILILSLKNQNLFLSIKKSKRFPIDKIPLQHVGNFPSTPHAQPPLPQSLAGVNLRHSDPTWKVTNVSLLPPPRHSWCNHDSRRAWNNEGFLCPRRSFQSSRRSAVNHFGETVWNLWWSDPCPGMATTVVTLLPPCLIRRARISSTALPSVPSPVRVPSPVPSGLFTVCLRSKLPWAGKLWKATWTWHWHVVFACHVDFFRFFNWQKKMCLNWNIFQKTVRLWFFSLMKNSAVGAVIFIMFVTLFMVGVIIWNNV